MKSALPAQPGPSDQWLPASAEKLPRWRGFNLLNAFKFKHQRAFDEADFRIVRELGFNFVRLPMDYLIWISDGDWTRIDEKALEKIDQAVAWGEKYRVHVCLNFHRAPGYCVNYPPEKRSVWTDPEAQRVCALHWAAFARRYKGIPHERLSFNLFNEPDKVDPEVYAAVAAKMVAAIRGEDPDCLIIADGLSSGNVPCPELIPLQVAQAMRGYNPMWMSHYRAPWVAGSDKWPEPTWPRSKPADEAFDRSNLVREQIAPWKALEAKGVGVFVGEWGCHNRTPHDVALRWMEDNLANYKEAGWGWALWNLYGSFGILDSGRADVVYEDFEGHKLDRRMLDLLLRY